jgi:hypothetical protein
LQHKSKTGVACLGFFVYTGLWLKQNYETEIRFCTAVAGVARLGRGFLLETTPG